MKKIKLGIFVALSGLWWAGCASTDTTSFVDPDYLNTPTPFSKVVVFVQSSSLQHEDNLESIFAEQFGREKVAVAREVDIFPPTRTFTDSARLSILKAGGYDAILCVNAGHGGGYEIPITSPTSVTTGRVSGNSYSGKTTYYSGLSIQGGWKEFEALLVDLGNGKTAWRASSTTSGAAAELGTYYAYNVVQRLMNDRLIKAGQTNGIQSTGSSNYTAVIAIAVTAVAAVLYLQLRH